MEGTKIAMCSCTRVPELPPCQHQQAAQLPARTAHVTYALMAALDAHDNRRGPLIADEICEYDDPVAAFTVRHTAAALREAQRAGLVSRWGDGYWTATERAWEMRAALEDRFLREVES